MGNGRKKRRVRPSPVPPSPTLKFSFKHLDKTNPRYSVQKCCVDFYRYMVQELMRHSHFTVEQFREQNNDDGRHRHYFPDTSEPNGFTCLNDPEGLEQEEAWQIRLCPNIHRPPGNAWRIHGVLLADVFYVVWLDYDHALYENRQFAPGG